MSHVPYRSQLLIAGERCAARNGSTFTRTNPIDGAESTIAAAGTVEDALAAVDAAAAAFTQWSSIGPSPRRELLLKGVEELLKRKEEFILAMAHETGASRVFAERNVLGAAGTLMEAAALTTQVGGDVLPSNIPGSLSLGLRRPAGVVLGIAPWNAPVNLGMRAIATPLACGNTVVLKGSESCPRTHELIALALCAAGLPRGVVNFITHAPAGAGAVVHAMVAHRAVRRVNFTGSTRVGRLIAQTCAQYLKPVVLELGGKAPFVVLDDADVDAAVSAASFGAFANSGQICMSTERLIVDEAVADEFVQKLAARAGAMSVGDPRQGHYVLGSVALTSTMARCNALIDDAVQAGAKVVCGGKTDSALMQPTLLDGVTPAMEIYTEETFAPVKGVVRVRGVDQAVALANDGDFGLSAAVFGRDLARAWDVAGRIESGMCHVNGPTVHDEPQMPFGGMKDSGYGRFGGRAGIEAFTELRWMSMQMAPRAYPF